MKHQLPTLILIFLAPVFLHAQTGSTDSIPAESDELKYVFIEEPAEFPGGIRELYKYLDKNLKYPEKAREADIAGIVYIEFIVEKDGSITNVKPKKGAHPLLDSAAVEVVRNMPAWIPAEQKGKKVRSMFIIPIQFQLDKNAAKKKRKRGK
ncbi:MAG: energy transducer TonB [Bacteroidales bacterium]